MLADATTKPDTLRVQRTATINAPPEIPPHHMEITDTAEPTRATIKLDFLSPFEAHDTAVLLG